MIELKDIKPITSKRSLDVLSGVLSDTVFDDDQVMKTLRMPNMNFKEQINVQRMSY